MKNTRPITFAHLANLIGETFDLPSTAITPETRCSDVPGWDSLGHSVLLSRLDKRLHLCLVEADAARADTVYEMFEKIANRSAGISE